MNICFKFLVTCNEPLIEGKDDLQLYGAQFPSGWVEPGIILKKKKTNLCGKL